MKIKHSEFIKSAVAPSGYPNDPLPEIAFLGKSNVGKSSLINIVLGRKKLAKVSSTPGKTTLINFFNVNDIFSVVDLPGYGYAKRSKQELSTWSNMIETYLSTRKNLILFLLLLDIRRVPSAEDLKIFKWLKRSGCYYKIILTKIDKLNQKETNSQLKLITESLAISKEEVICTSTIKKKGIEEILQLFEKKLSEGGYLSDEN